ncbi:MAG TPA: 50S ribosomal protein L21 [bacterium]|nr:50S ribosomal protein L21 [bacterium]
MAAIIKMGGKQITVNEGDRVKVEKIEGAEGETIKIDSVLAVIKGDEAVFGKPFVEGAVVEAKVIGHGKRKKVIVFKYKPKKRYRITNGHRQRYTEIEIDKIITA